jgi:hypothetical protein
VKKKALVAAARRRAIQRDMRDKIDELDATVRLRREGGESAKRGRSTIADCF